MSELYDYYSKNGPCIVQVDNGRVIRVRFPNTVLQRGMDDSEAFYGKLEWFLNNLAQYFPTKFIQLYMSLYDDNEAMELATSAYNTYVGNTAGYDLETIKKLMKEDTSELKGESSYYGFDRIHCIEVKSGIIVRVIDGKQVERNDAEFCYTITTFITRLSQEKSKEFMRLYDAIKNDEICFKIADDIRNKKANSFNKSFCDTTENTESDICQTKKSESSQSFKTFYCEKTFFCQDRIIVNDGAIVLVVDGEKSFRRGDDGFYETCVELLKRMSACNRNKLRSLCSEIVEDEIYYKISLQQLETIRQKVMNAYLSTGHVYKHQSMF